VILNRELHVDINLLHSPSKNTFVQIKRKKSCTYINYFDELTVLGTTVYLFVCTLCFEMFPTMHVLQNTDCLFNKLCPVSSTSQ